MGKSQKPSTPPPPDWTDAGARVRWLLAAKFGGNRSAMARTIGFSHTIIANVVKGKAPGRFLLDAIVDRLGVDADWLRGGVGQPYPADGGAGVPAGAPVTNVLLPGPPLRHQAMVTGGWVEVPGIMALPGAYWLALKGADPLVRRPSSGFSAGDHLLMEADPARFPREEKLYETLCAVKKGPDLRLAYVSYVPASVDDGAARLDADFPAPAAKVGDGVERVYRHFSDGEVRVFERPLTRTESTSTVPASSVIRYGDIVAVWQKIIHRTLG